MLDPQIVYNAAKDAKRYSAFQIKMIPDRPNAHSVI